MKILVCVKEEVLRTALEFRLRRQGYTVESVPDGAAAYDEVGSWSPDLCIIGSEIAKLPGLELVEKLRNDGTRTPALPIILVAPLEAEDDILRGFELGIDDFVTKPFKPVELVLRVQRLIESLSS